VELPIQLFLKLGIVHSFPVSVPVIPQVLSQEAKEIPHALNGQHAEEEKQDDQGKGK